MAGDEVLQQGEEAILKAQRHDDRQASAPREDPEARPDVLEEPRDGAPVRVGARQQVALEEGR
eukprot:CAMPEP_0198597296 /NCGR_PEP_ID=MMETSP1462-20131121/144275_1 /TAXON_ID=1333877 /ORGANISM="Brandtodinium nutriculum, Strain RCC3387" /LENGTH=62 /DNA_ID=CAMNT_0044328955 /DNA_START=223 /DNA_END=409 /DNA_ORIENTATION=+